MQAHVPLTTPATFSYLASHFYVSTRRHKRLNHVKLSLPASVTDAVGQTLKRSTDVTNIVKRVNCWLLLPLELQHAQIFKTSSYMFHERSGDEQFVTDDHFYLHLKVSMLQCISGWCATLQMSLSVADTRLLY